MNELHKNGMASSDRIFSKVQACFSFSLKSKSNSTMMQCFYCVFLIGQLLDDVFYLTWTLGRFNGEVRADTARCRQLRWVR